MERERSGERSKLAAQISLSGDVDDIVPSVALSPITLNSGTNTRQIKFAA